VIIWTRVTPEEISTEPIPVAWRVATDVELENVVASGEFITSSDRDYTVKIDVTGLEAGSTYYYGFSALSANSLTGKTKTTPTASATEHLRFGVVSCSNYQAGYFNAYGQLAQRNDLDAIIHLGDYIYEVRNHPDGPDPVANDRQVEPGNELITLIDYRTRYSIYRLDSQLLRAHQQHPMVAVWDDHEYANDTYDGGAQGHQSPTEGAWEERKAQARQAYFEWMPVREMGNGKIYRKLQYGNLLDLFLLDTRLEGREKQISDVTDSTLYATDRTLLGTVQKEWLKGQLIFSTAKWKIIGQQVMFSPFNIGWAGLAVNETYNENESRFLDIWDGYPAERTEMINFLSDNELDNLVILTGNFHSSLVYEVADPPNDVEVLDFPGFGMVPVYSSNDTYESSTGKGAVAVEFLTPSITSANFDELIDSSEAVQLGEQLNTPLRPFSLELGIPNPHMKFADLTRHGYFLFDVRSDSVQADYYFSNIRQAGAAETFAAGFSSQVDTNQVKRVFAPSPEKTVQDIPAPSSPPDFINATVNPNALPGFRVLSLYPNPAGPVANLHYGLNQAMSLSIDLLDASGRLIRRLEQSRKPAGLYTLSTDLSGLTSGTYFYRIEGPSGVTTQAFLKK
ncbi:MAG: alkaline phosphatase D family protein, partial [Bacteroidota bacterium]